MRRVNNKNYRAKRISAYTTAASTGAFALCNGVNAAVVYQDYTDSPLTLQTLEDNGSSLYNNLELDIDNDGIIDVSFSLYNYAGDQTDHIEVEKNTSAPKVKILTSDQLLAGDRFYPVQSFAAGALISNNTPEAVGHNEIEIRLSQHDGLTYFADPGRYLGLVTSAGFNAWIEIQIDTSNIKRAKLEIKGFAYEDSGKPLQVGPNEAMIEPYKTDAIDEAVASLAVSISETNAEGEYPEDVVTIPEPAFTTLALGLLSAGALGLATWRRNKLQK